jgi:glutamyl-tRNA synthetase
MRNYLVRLGWSHGDQEIFSTEELISAFDLPAIGRAPARLDLAKLDNLNGHYIRQMADADLVAEIERILPYVPNGAELAGKIDQDLRGRLVAAMPGLKERAKTLVELIESARYLYADRPLKLEDKAAALITPEARDLLGHLARDFAALEPWTAANAEAAVRTYAERAGVKLGSVAQPLRAALTGRTTSPGIFDVLAVLGKTESLARIGDQVAPAA